MATTVDSATVKVVEQVVQDKTQNGEMFTAWDVTCELRKRGHGGQYKHDALKQVVHDLYGRGQMDSAYTRTNVNVANSPVPPYVYHRTVDDPQQYAAAVGATVVQPTASNPNATIAVPKQDDDDEDEEDEDPKQALLVGHQSLLSVGNGKAHKTDARGTLCVSAVLLRQAGLLPGSKVGVYPAAGGVAVKVLDPSGPFLGRYTVDYHNNVRITKAALKKAGLDDNNVFDFIGMSDGVSVTSK